MIIYRDITLEPVRCCSYLEDQQSQFEYFLASDVNEEQLELLFSSGWRKFGIYYFRPSCPNCLQCLPIRVLANEFKPSKSQRKVCKKNRDVRVEFRPLEYSEEIYTVYQDHSWNRFGQETSREEFRTAHYMTSCPSLQAEYYLGSELIAVGFLDRSSMGLSSSYFVYKDTHSNLSLGTYSVIAEAQYCAQLGLSYYYLGFYIAKNHFMSYKNRFYPHEIYDWTNQVWQRHEKSAVKEKNAS